jgi:RHS repeat-associated protein
LNQVLEESSVVGATPTATYTLGSGIVSQKRSGTVSHFLADGHGSNRMLAGTNASITARFTYDAYGNPLDFTANLYNTPATTLLYSGQQFDTDLQQYNSQARYYDPAVGRFGQADPFSGKQQGGANLYAYCEGDPVNSVDPTGLYEIDVHQFLTRFLAEQAGFANAQNIGVETQRLDEDNRDARYGPMTINLPNMKKYHFVTRDRLWTLAAQIRPGGSEREIGEFLHAQEDTYAHSTGVGNRNWDYYGNLRFYNLRIFENGQLLGHGPKGHAPDHTWRDPNKAMVMARRVYEDLKYIKAHGNYDSEGWFAMTDPPYPSQENGDPVWDGVKDTIKNFVTFVPEVNKDFGFETVTQKGYLEKVRQLFPGYTLQDGDATFLREKHKTQKSSIKHVNEIYDALSDLGGVAAPY